MGFEDLSSQEKIPPTREIVVEALTNRGIDDPEVKAMLIEYAEIQEIATDMLGGHYAHEEVAIHMAELYFDANYKEYAVESLEEMENLLSGGQISLVEGELLYMKNGEDHNMEILEKIRSILDRMYKSME